VIKQLIGYIVVLLSMTPLFSGDLAGDSPFAIGSFGMPVMEVDGRGMGMGGVSVALGGENFSLLNPATLAGWHRSGISGQVIPVYSFPRDRSASSSNRSYEFSYVRMVFPIPSKFVVSAGVQQFLDFDWEVDRPFTFQGATLTETFRSSGTVFKAQVAVARALFAGLQAGAGLDFYRGGISDDTGIAFQNTFYPAGTAIDVNDEYSYETSGFGITTGLFYTPYRRLNLGFYIIPSLDLRLDETFKTAGGVSSEQVLSAGIPLSWGVGSTFRLRKDLLVAFDHLRTAWSSFALEGSSLQLRDEWTYSIGAEFTSSQHTSQSWLKRSSFRAGFRLRSLPMEIEGNEVRERVGTFGIGVPIGHGNGRLDLALEAGSRGGIETNGIRERLVRIGVSLSAFEKWLPITRRRR
jgi:hypothetical protein